MWRGRPATTVGLLSLLAAMSISRPAVAQFDLTGGMGPAGQ
jgi:hypothetical protein